MKQTNEAELVARGAKLMDKILPGWHKRVKLESLVMNDSTMCLLGQMFGLQAETCLAKEMYPQEWADAKTASYVKPTFGYYIGLYAVPKIMRKLGMDMRENEEISTLYKVCKGHNNKCEWANEIAARLAADELQDNSQPGA